MINILRAKMTPEYLAGILHQTDIFSLVSMDMLKEIIPELTIHSFHKDDLIISKGESGDKMFVLVSGKAKIHDKDHILATVESGTYFGEFFYSILHQGRCRFPH